MKILLTTAAVFLFLASQAFADARKDKVQCVLDLTKGGKTEFTIPLQDFEDKEIAETLDGAVGTAKVKGYTIRYVTVAGEADCPECKTGATRVFYSTLTLSRGKISEDTGDGVFADLEFKTTKVPGVKTLSCTYVADPTAQ